ncbi:pentatricopeptide repeat-containing protein At4g39530-like [Corylus avellana]|uniref:pentatricopeptide repeat-containing protein At4g39530-like n=1 Tax=Corylus avellana TaxID=13451 RepID=UPI00286BFC9A|nr:pentatricopeptide repeat-containing protein At4g39530-like [Corylus avellana]
MNGNAFKKGSEKPIIQFSLSLLIFGSMDCNHSLGTSFLCRLLRKPRSVSFATAIPYVKPSSSLSDSMENSAACFDGRFQNILKKLSNHNLLKPVPSIADVNLDSNERLGLYSEVLRSCALKRCLNEGKAVHGQVIKNGMDPDSHFWRLVVEVYVKGGSLQCARQVLDEMRERDVVSWTALVEGWIDKGYSRDGIRLYSEMRKDGVRPNEQTLMSVLKGCSECLELDIVSQLHAEIIKIGFFSDMFVGSTLVDLYSKCGEMELASMVFFYISEKSVVSWNALLDGYAQVGDWEEILKLFSAISELELKYGKFTLLTVLKSCAHLGNLRGGQAVHALVTKMGSELDKFLICCILNMYSKCGLPDYALKVFERIKNPKIVAWSTMINCLDQQGQSQEAAEMFCLMRRTGVTPNEYTLASIISAANSLGNWKYGDSIHACVYKHGLESDNFISSALVTMYMKTGCVHNGWQVFNTMNVRDIASWNALLSGFHDNKTFDQGPRIFKELLVVGFKPDIYTFISILKSCSNILDVDFGKQIHAHIIKDGLCSNSSIGTALIDMYFKCWCLEDADIILNELTERDLLTWTVIISSYVQTNQGEKAVKCFSQLQREGLKPNAYTLSCCLSGCSSLALLDSGRQLHSMVIKSGLSSNMYIATALVDMYGQCRRIEDAEAIFKSMTYRNAVLWNTIICGYSLNGQGKEALEAFRIMLDEGVLPDEITFIGVLSACSHMGLIEEGEKHFNSLSKDYGITPSIEHYACMVNILGRAGKFSEVQSFVEKWELTQNVLIWETILWASKMHGNVEVGERAAEKVIFELETDMDYNYVMLSHILAAKGRWDDVVKVRTLMSNLGITKEPACSWLVIDAQAHKFFAHDMSHPKIKEICQYLEGMAR